MHLHVTRLGDAAVSAVQCHVYQVPTDQPEADGTLEWSSTTVVVVQVEAGGATGLGWTYGAGACRAVVIDTLSDVVKGRDVHDVGGAHEAMVRSIRNQGRAGVVSSAISAVDIALWDCKSRLLGVSLVSLFGRCAPSIPIYGSGGFTTYSDTTTANQLEKWVSEQGISAVKIKIGESWGANPARDLARCALARKVLGDTTELFVDANGAYTRKQAVRIGRRLSEEFGVSWFEEPVSSDDLAGLREVRDQLPLDVAAGEYGYDETYFAKMVDAEAVDCLQADVTRCGGYTSWLRAAAIAASHGLDISAHCAPNLHAHVAAAVPRLRHVEYFHDHVRLDNLLFTGTLEPWRGSLTPDADRVGHGMALREESRAYLVEG